MAGTRKQYELLFQLNADTARFKQEFKGAGESSKALKSHMAALSTGMKDVSAYQNQQKAMDKTKEKIRTLQEGHDKLQAELKQTGSSTTADAEKLKKYTLELESNRQKLTEQEKVLAQMGTGLKNAGLNTENLSEENRALRATYDDLARSERSIAKLTQQQKENTQAIADTRRELAATAAAYVAIGVAAYTAFVTPAAAFEAQMSTVASISGASMAGMAELSELAKEMGATTKFTAVEAGKGFEYMAMAGWDTNEMLSGLPGIMQLAAASGEDLAAVSDIVTDALTAFGLKASDSMHFSDVLAKTAASANTNVGLMGETFKYVAPMAGAMGYSIEDMSVAIGLMANSGIKGSMAGTTLRNIITNLAAPTDATAAAMEKLNVSVANADGSTKPFQEVMHSIRDGMAGISSEAEKIELAKAIGGQRGMAGLLAVVNASEEEFEALYGKIEDCAGAAQKMSEVRMDNLNGDITMMKSAWDGMSIAIGDQFIPALREGTQQLTEYIDNARDWVEQNGELLVQIVKVAGGLAAMKLGFLAAKLGVLGLQKGILSSMKVFAQLNAGIKVLASGGTVSAAATAITGLTASMATFAGVAAGVVIVAAAVGVGLYTAWQDAKRAELDRRFGDITLSMEEMEAVATQLVDRKSMEKAAQALEAFDGLETVKNDIQAARKELEKFNWKLGIGITLTKEEGDIYKQEVQNYVKGMQQYVDDHGYAVQLGVSALFKSDNPDAQKIMDSVGKTTASLQGQLSQLGADLGSIVEDAFVDGIFDFSNTEVAAKLQEKMAEIADLEQKITDSRYKAKIDMVMSSFGGDLTPEDYQQLQEQLNAMAQEHAETIKETYESTFAGLHLGVSVAQDAYDKNPNGDTSDLLTEAKEALSAFQQEVAVGEQAMQGYVDATTFGLNTIMEKYPEFLELLGETNGVTTSVYEELAKDGPVSMEEFAKATWDATREQRDAYDKLDATTKATLSQCIGYIDENIVSIQAQIEVYKEAGKAIPEEIQAIMRAYEGLGMLSKTGHYKVDKQGYRTEGFDQGNFLYGYVETFPTPQQNQPTPSKHSSSKLIAPTTAVRPFSVPGFYNGTNYTPDAFLAGERGTELITNAPGRTVFTASETNEILNHNQYRNEDSPAAPAVQQTLNSRVSTQTPTLQVPIQNMGEYRIEIQYTPTIHTGGGAAEWEEKLKSSSDELAETVLKKIQTLQKNERRQTFD